MNDAAKTEFPEKNAQHEVIGETPVGEPAPPEVPRSLEPVEKVWGRTGDVISALIFAAICFVVLFFTAADYGVTWDEAAPNFVAARNQAEWFSGLFTLEHPFSRETIDQYWASPSKHPSLTRSLMALSLNSFGPWLKKMEQRSPEGLLDSRFRYPNFAEVVALRIPSMALTSLLMAVMYIWLARRINCVAALGTIGTLITLPRVFADVHLASLDVPMMVWWALVVVAFYEGAERPLISRFHLLTGLLYGLALSTKLHSFFLPIPLLVWAIVYRKKNTWRAFASMAILGPLIYLLTQVYLWPDPWHRLLERFISYGTKDVVAPVRVLYLGHIYVNQTPWHYPIIMALVTLPAVSLFFVVLGSAGLGRLVKERPLMLLIVLNVLVPLFIITLPHAQGYDGIRLILPAMPWIAVLAGVGLYNLFSLMRSPFVRWGEWMGKTILVICLLILLIPNLYVLDRIHPFQLEYYADWIGGIPGGQRMGMESTYWCNTLRPELLDVINRTVPDGAKLRPMAMSYDVLEEYKRLGLLKETITIGGDPPYDYHLLQCRQGFFGRMESALYLGQMGPPMASVSYQSVPFYMFFAPWPEL